MRRREFLHGAAGFTAYGLAAAAAAGAQPRALTVGVVGGGIVGASIALHLAQAGAHVMLFEKTGPAKGATQNSFGFLNIFDLDRHYQALRQQSVLAYRDLDTPFQLGITWGGYIDWANDSAEGEGVRALGAVLDGTPYAVRPLTAKDFLAISPAIAPGAISAAFFSPLAGHVDPVWVTYRFLDAAKSYGAKMLCPCEVYGLDFRQQRLIGITTSQGKFPLDRLIVAAGVDTPHILSMAGFDLRLRHSPGILAHSVPIPELTKIVYDGPGGMEFKQMANGRIVGTDSLEAPDISVHGEIRRHGMDFPDAALRTAHGSRILKRIATVLPGASDVILDRLTLGFRPMPIDGFPVAGRIPGAPDVYVAVTHSGVTLAPILGRYISQEVLTGAQVDALAPYRPTRFGGVSPVGTLMGAGASLALTA
jgi:glycine/D-amino acid oxidase-like deaminating enzyme